MSEKSSGNFVSENRGWLLLILVAVLSILLAESFSYAFSLKANVLEVSTLITVLGPAFVAALLVERAVEVVIAGTRLSEKKKLNDNFLETQEALETAADSERQDLEAQSKDLSEQIQTQNTGTLHMAVGFNLAFSFLLALVGVRILAQFFDVPLIECMSDPILTDPEECPDSLTELREHYRFFVGVDLLVTTFVIAGGSEGLHSIVNAITKFADKTGNSNS